MAVWDAGQYLKFGDHRLRPGLELLARIPLDAPRVVWDLGCGTGNLTEFLRRRWPEARVTGLDNSPEMLAKARAIDGIDWVDGDVATWAPPTPPDVIFSNACLHWLPDHAALFARLVGFLAPGGALAVQMPRNHRAPSHVLLAETAREGRWAKPLAAVRGIEEVAEPGEYHGWLAPHGAPDIWETEYLQVLTGEHAVVEWVKGTALKPYLDALDAATREAFLDAYRQRVARAYPRRADGTTLFPFRRIFIVATKR
jgi:trans-aconitate 2-methyltransferase